MAEVVVEMADVVDEDEAEREMLVLEEPGVGEGGGVGVLDIVGGTEMSLHLAPGAGESHHWPVGGW